MTEHTKQCTEHRLTRLELLVWLNLTLSGLGLVPHSWALALRALVIQ